MVFFGDEPGSRHHFSVRYDHFWRRDLFSSPFFGEKRFFWRRARFSSPLLVEKRFFLTTSPILVTIISLNLLFCRRKPTRL
ncbi:hypothetical protein [Caldibacillus thermoamylovorans]|uniref:hypothetical protein n=1 Tax=Caldibacillus thermoamylovorans TaxID=35841 RepID=UPI0012603DD2|nr:hypothetical protein [Caldibacillus thermoamylovorans]